MLFFFFFFFANTSRQARIRHLSSVVTNRESLNHHISSLQRLSPSDTPETAEVGGDAPPPLSSNSWSDEELDAVLSRGLEALSDVQLTWLAGNPIALFELFDAINELLPECWMKLVLADAKQLWERRPDSRHNQDVAIPQLSAGPQQADVAVAITLDGGHEALESDDVYTLSPDILSRLVTDRQSLVAHVRTLQTHSHGNTTDSWLEDELQQVLESGLSALSRHRLRWLAGNPIALFELFDAINEALPPYWIDLVLADAKRLWDSRPNRDETSKASAIRPGVINRPEGEMSTWLYFAATAKANRKDTLDLARHGFIWRSAHNSLGHAVANTRKVAPRDRIILLYEGVPQGIFRVLSPGRDQVPGFPAIARFPAAVEPHLAVIGYRKDTMLDAFTGFLVEEDAAEGDEHTWCHGKLSRSGRSAIQPMAAAMPPSTSTSKESTCVQGSATFKLHCESCSIRPARADGTLHFLGVDVGYAEHDKTLGYCVLALNDKTLRVCHKVGQIRGFGLATLAAFRTKFLPDLLDSRTDGLFTSIVLDGPLTPRLCNNPPPWYRPQEQLLLRGVFPRRVKAQPYQSPVGQELYMAAMQLRSICESQGYRYQSFSQIQSAQGGLVLESFPKSWLATFFDPQFLDDNLSRYGVERSQADFSMAQWLFRGRPESLQGGIGDLVQQMINAGLSLDLGATGTETVLGDKDMTAAFVSALGGVLSHMGWASVLGSDAYGSFLLPASGLWHQGWRNLLQGMPLLPNLEFRDNM